MVLFSISSRHDRADCVRKPLPLTTVELQKAGSRLLRMAPKRVLDVRPFTTSVCLILKTRLRLLKASTKRATSPTLALKQTNSTHSSISPV